MKASGNPQSLRISFVPRHAWLGSLLLLFALMPSASGQVAATSARLQRADLQRAGDAPVSQIRDLEPFLDAALDRLTDRLVLELPLVAADSEGLCVQGARRHHRRDARALEARLVAEGFKRLSADAPGVFTLVLAHASDGELASFEVHSPQAKDWSIVVDHGYANWVIEHDPGHRVVLGAWRASTAQARASVAKVVQAAYAEELGVDGDARGLRACVARLAGEEFVQVRTTGGVRLERVLKRVPLDRDTLDHMSHLIRRAEGAALRDRWKRRGLGALLSLGLWLLYLRADLATRGYMTGRLRLLLLALVAGGWVFALEGPL